MPRTRRRSVSRDVLAIRKSLATIARALGRLGPALAAGTHHSENASGHRRRKLRLSAARRGALKLQGQYMGYLRNLKPRQKDRVKTLRSARGVQAAIRFAKKLAKRQS